MKKFLLLVAAFFLLLGGVCSAGQICHTFCGELPYLAGGPTWWNGIAVTNESPTTQCLKVAINGGEQVCYKIKPNGVTVFILPTSEPCYATLQACYPLIVTQVSSDNQISFSEQVHLESCVVPEPF